LPAQVSLQRNDVDTPSITLHTPPRDLQAPPSPRPSSPDLLGRSLHPPPRLIRPAQPSPLPLSLLQDLGAAVPLLRCFSASWTLSHRGLPPRRRVSITLLSWRGTLSRTRRTKMRGCLVRGRSRQKGHGRPSPFPAHRATLAGERVSVVLAPELCLANKNPSCQITTEDSRAPLFFSGYVALHSLRIYTRVDAQYTRGHHSTP
jgi:hypothetical protein